MLIDFEGTLGDEMTVRTGDLVKKVTKASEEGWLEGEIHGCRGIFPANFAKVTCRRVRVGACYELALVLMAFIHLEHVCVFDSP